MEPRGQLNFYAHSHKPNHLENLLMCSPCFARPPCFSYQPQEGIQKTSHDKTAELAKNNLTQELSFSSFKPLNFQKSNSNEEILAVLQRGSLNNDQKESLRKRIESFSLTEQEALFKKIAQAALTKKEIINIFTEVASEKTLLDYVQHIRGSSIKLVNLAKSFLDACPQVEEKQQSSPTSNPICRFFSKLLDNLMNAINLLEVGREPSTYYETSYMLDIIWKLLGILSAIWILIKALFVELALSTLAFSATVLTLGVALYVYFKWLQPVPKQLPFCTNLTELALDGRLNGTYTQREAIEKIEKVLSQNSSGSKRHPLLVGDTGVGKTEYFHAIAKRLAISSPHKQLHYTNANHLAEHNGAFQLKNPLQQIRSKIGKHDKEVILCLDEVDKITSESSSLGGDLLSLLDTSSESISYCIAATTVEGYKKTILNTPFQRRFCAIDISQATSDETLTILRQQKRIEGPSLPLDDATLLKIYNDSMKQKGNQPDKAKSMLAAWMQEKRAILSGENFKTRLTAIEQEKINLTYSKQEDLVNSLLLKTEAAKERDKKLVELQTEEDQLNIKLEAQEKRVSEWEELLQERKSLLKNMQEKAQHIVSNNSNVREIKRFLFQLSALLPELDETIKAKEIEIGLVDNSLF